MRKSNRKVSVTKRVSAIVAAAVLAMSMTVTAFATIPELQDAQPANLTVTADRSAHTYTYWQMFTGTWAEEEGKVFLSDAAFGSDINKAGLIAYLKANYTSEINDIYVNRAKKEGLIGATGKIADVKNAVGNTKWANSKYNIDYVFGATAPTNAGEAAKRESWQVEDILDLFKYFQSHFNTVKESHPFIAGYESNPYKSSETATYEKDPMGRSDDHKVEISNGNLLIAHILEKFVNGNGTAITADYNQTKTNTVANGYYLISEKDTGWNKGGRNSSNSQRFSTMLKIVDRNITISPKIGTPTMEKKIAENIKNVRSVGSNLIGAYKDNPKWNDAGDYSIGDDVRFALFGSMPENIDDYTHYFYQFKDRLAKGFVKPATNDIKVEIGKTNPVQKPSDADNAASNRTFTGATDVTNKAKISVTGGGNAPCSIVVTFDDIKSLGVDIDMDTVVRVTYKAKMDTDAVVGEYGNTNGASLVYTHDLNYDGSGITEDNAGTRAGEDNKEINTKANKKTAVSETLEDGVTAFTYQISVLKVDGETNENLEGAMFTLQAKNGAHNGLYVKVNNEGKVIGWTENAGEANYLTTNEDGQIRVIGLDDGAYEIVEVKAPKGYNSLREAVPVTLKAGLNDNGTYTYIQDDGRTAYLSFTKGAGEGMAAVNKADGLYSLTIANNKGIELPQTGGKGTMVIYAASGLLLVAGTVYVVKRKKEQD